MEYVARVTREGRHWLAEFPDCPGCQTFAASADALKVEALDALTGWVETMLQVGRLPPRPVYAAKKGMRVPLPARLAVRVQLRWAREDAGLTQAKLAKRAGVSQQAIAKIEHPDGNPTMETLEKVAIALGARLEVELVVPQTRKAS